jgi:hypothetical protein
MSRKYIKFDLEYKDPNLDALILKAITDFYNQAHKQGHIPKRKRKDVITKQAKIAKTIILNVALAEDHSVSLSLSKRFFDSSNRYRNKIFDHKNTKDAINAFSEYIHLVTGSLEFSDIYQELNKAFGEPLPDGYKPGELPVNATKIPSELTPTEKGVDLINSIDHDLIYLSPYELIVIKKSSGKAPKLQYKDNQYTIKARQNLEQINEFLSKQDYSYNDNKIPFSPLYRIFHKDTNHYGRFEGGVFSYRKEKLYRPNYKINNEQLIELDYSACALSILEIKHGNELANSDPYLKGRLSEFPREFVKKLVTRHLFAERTNRIFSGGRALLKRLDSIHKNTKTKEINRLLTNEYPSLINKSKIDLFNIEATILEEALLNCIKHNVPAISLHDCIYVPESKQKEATEIFKNAPKKVIGSEIPFTIKRI